MESEAEQLLSRAKSPVAKFHWRQGRETGDIHEAIDPHREDLDPCPLGHAERSGVLNDLAADLYHRYSQFGTMRDLEEAIVLGREALNRRPPGHSRRSTSLITLANFLLDRYDLLGLIQDLDDAIVFAREALHLRPPGHSLRFTSLNNLAKFLSDRYKRLGSVQDLDEIVVLAREALNLRPPGHSLRFTSLSNLAIFLSYRYQRLRSMQDLDEIIVLAREALDLRPPGHSLRFTSLDNLSKCLSDRYKQLESMQDLDEAIALAREALDICPLGHHLRSNLLNNLANHLSDRYDRLGSMQDLDEAVVLGREATGFYPQGDPHRSQSLANIETYFHQRFTRSAQFADKEELFTLYSQLVHLDQFVSSSHLASARAWLTMAERLQQPTLLLAYETSIRLLIHLLTTLPSLPLHLSVLKKHASSVVVEAFSACLRNRAPAYAVELLEQGRGVFWSQLTRLHSPLHDVRASGPEGEKLADEFTRMSFLIQNVLNSPAVGQHERMCRLNVEMQTIVANIRGLPGFSRFLLPSLFSDLQHAASGGPVIIVNASEYSCDALIVLHDRDPVHAPLRITLEDARNLTTELHTLTKRTKKADIVSPIVDVLQTIIPFHTRIWWCPTSEFSLLPLHAASPFRRDRQSLPDLYISSYTPTLTALIRARRHSSVDPITEPKRFIAIGQGNAPGETELPSVAEELDMIGQGVDGLTAFTRVDGGDACVSKVVEELGKNEWVHLACHGLPNPERPFESAFAFRDEHFTVQRIIGCELKNPEFIYLSACHTTVGDEESPDEAIHLASAMHFVGFRSVIGTMWAVDDDETKKIAPVFYKHVVDESGRLDYTQAAYALNMTMRTVDVPLDQRILYIHIGA